MRDKDLSRRGFFRFGAASATAGAVVTQSSRAAAAPHPDGLPQVPRRRLGKTGQDVPILQMGGALEHRGRFDPRLPECLRFGINGLHATDPGAESAIGRYHVLAGNRSELWLTSGTHRFDPEGFTAELDASLRRLQSDHVESYLVQGLRDPRELSPGLAKAVDTAKRQGKLLHFGLAFDREAPPELLVTASGLGWVETVALPYERLSSNAPGLDAAHRADIGIVAVVEPADGGAPEPEQERAALEAIWADARIAAVVARMATFDDIKANVAAALKTAHRLGT